VQDGIPQVVKDFAEGVSEGGEVQNRYWIALAVASFFVLVPEMAPDGTVVMPFGLPHVEGTWFALLAVLLLSALSLTFAASHAHLIRALELAHQVLRQRGPAGADEIDERDMLSALTRPSLDHVSSIAYVFRGYDVFFHNKGDVDGLRHRLSLIFFAYLKLVVTVVWLLLPALVLCVAASRYSSAGPPDLAPWLWGCVVWPLWASAICSLLAAVWLQFRYVRQVLKTLWKDA